MKSLSFLESLGVKGHIIGSTGEFVFIPPKMQSFEAGVVKLEVLIIKNRFSSSILFTGI